MTRPQWWYAHYNKQHFGGSLPKANVTWKHLLRKHNALGHYHYTVWDRFDPVKKKFTRENPHLEHFIELDPKFDGTKVFQLTLLHEMCHLAVTLKSPLAKGHGRLWQNEMKRLAAKGAFANLW